MLVRVCVRARRLIGCRPDGLLGGYLCDLVCEHVAVVVVRGHAESALRRQTDEPTGQSVRIFRARVRMFRARVRVFRVRVRMFRARVRVFRARVRVFRIRVRMFRIRVRIFRVRARIIRIAARVMWVTAGFVGTAERAQHSPASIG